MQAKSAALSLPPSVCGDFSNVRHTGSPAFGTTFIAAAAAPFLLLILRHFFFILLKSSLRRRCEEIKLFSS